MATSQPSAAAIAQLAGLAHITPQEAKQRLQAAASSTGYQPFSLSGQADQGTLWLGAGVAKPGSLGVPGLPAMPKERKFYTVTWQGQKINVEAPDFGAGYSVHLRASLAGVNKPAGGVYNRDDIAKADPNKSTFWIEIDDAHGKSIWQKNLYDIAPEAGMILLGRSAQLSAPGQGPLQKGWSIDPYADAVAGKGTPAQDQTATVEHELKGLYNMDPKKIAGMKHELWLAGYYGNKKLTEVDMKTITNDDITAFGNLMIAATRYYAAGKKIKWQDLLHEQATGPSAQTTTAGGAVILTDPEVITKTANDAASKLLGHAANPKDVQALISLIHGKETAYDTALNANKGTAYSEDQGAQGADVEKYFRDKYPNETMGVDWGNAAQQWEQMLATPPVNQPGTTSVGNHG